MKPSRSVSNCYSGFIPEDDNTTMTVMIGNDADAGDRNINDYNSSSNNNDDDDNLRR